MRILRFSLMALAFAAMVFPLATSASDINPRIPLFFRNNTPHYVWVTIYEPLCKVVCHDEIIKDQFTRPREVAPGKNAVFNLPRYGKYKVRSQALDACGHGIRGGDTNMTFGGIGYTTPSISVTVHKAHDRQSYWLTRP